ncbi:hypothetical protein [Halococcus qingdaonensis]|uniref:hypothetical protein n=1 Tax=Halococcus qingdaonensis TaxID=224402 RepID=UPI002116C770|nr:hypothetical protein [Halococcus qingdaonensis]
MTGASGRLIARLPFRAGALVGAAAYLLGYLLTYLLTISRVRSELSRMNVDATLSLLGGSGVAPWKVTGWFFYGAHFVDVSVTSSAMDLSTDVVEVSAGGWRTLLFALPPLLLLVAGALAAHRAGARRVSIAAAAGGTILPGYFALAFVGVFLTQVTVLIAAVGPNLTPALVAGVVYPLVFGPLGGAVLVAVQRSRARSSPHDSNP